MEPTRNIYLYNINEKILKKDIVIVVTTVRMTKLLRTRQDVSYTVYGTDAWSYSRSL